MCTSSRVRKPLAVLVASFLLFQWSVVPALAQTSPRPAQESKPTGGGTTAQASQGTSTAMEDPGPDAGIASPPGAFSVQAFQTDLFTGAAAATIPIVIPPGTAGVAPKLVLRYNSGTVDDSWMADNHPPLDQAPWTGLGWTLDVGGMILRDPKGTPETLADDTLKLVFDGVAHDLVLVDPGQWLYRTKDERFWRIQYVQSLDEWKLWTKDGTLHRFGSTRDGKGITYFGDLIHTYTYKYLLDEVVTPGGTGVRYAYYRQQATSSNGQTYDRALYPEFIRYTYQNGDPVGSAREIHFVRAARTDYTDSTATTRFSFFEDQLLDKIEVRVGGQFVRRYDFSYDYSIRRDPTYTWGGGATGDLTLRLVTQVGTDEVSTLPPLSFTYRDALLESVSNRFGGTVTYTYDPAPTNPIWSAHTTYSNWACGDFGVRTNRGPAECASSAVLLGHALRTNESGTIPLYSACNLLIESGSGYQCQDYGVSNSRGTYPASTFARLVGYVFPTSQPGTRQIFSTYKSVIVDVDQIAHCVDMGISDTLVPLCCVCVPTGGLLENEPVGYVPLTGVDRARVITRGVNDGRGTLGTTTYAYGTPQWGGPHGNEFWGHSWVRVTDPAGHYSTVWYHQDEAKKGRASQVETRSSTGALFTRVENTWTTSTPSPGVTVVALTETNGYTYDGDSSFKQVRQTFAYDAYGNATELHHEGDVAASGDERTEVLEYAYNTGAYIVGLPSHTVTRDASETPVAEAWLHYDGATSHTTPPTAGRLTKQCHWLDGGTNPCVELTYDEWGNVHTVKDARGNITTVDYDTAHRTFPASVTTPATPNAPNGLTTTYTYDEKFGAVLTTRDPNNQTTTNGYDRFGRLTSVTNALNQTTTISYPNLGNPATQHVRVELPDGQGGVLWTQTYFDGLGRTYRVKKNAAAGVVLLDTAYDTRGLVASKALPRFEGATSVPIAYGYDALGRLTRTDYPDDTFETAAYSDWTTMITDRNGHARSSLKDAYGRVTQITEPGGALTHYGYDTMGRLTSVTDAASHITSIVYDTLGRKIRMTEPNMGTWTYSYDANGNLLTQIDAKHQPLAFQYDALNRLTTKTYPGPGFYPLTRSEKSGFEGYTALYRGGMCLAGCTGGDVWTKAGLGPSLGYMKDSEGTGTQPVYPSTCYSDSAGTCTGWGLSLDANGSPVGYLSQTNPNPGVALTQSGGLLYQGLGGTPSAYLWTSPPAATRTDHFYTTDGTVPLGYTEQGLLGYLAEVGGSGTVTLTRYVHTNGSHYYSTSADGPDGYAADATLGYLQTSGGSGLTLLARHYNSSTGDYLLSTSTTPPGGYTYQGTLGYLHTPGTLPGGTVTFTYDADGVNGKGRRTGMADFAGGEGYVYDALGRLSQMTRVIDGVAYTTATTYTPFGAPLTLRYPDAETLTSHYTTGQLTSLTTSTGATYVSGITYNAAGQLTGLTYGNGAGTSRTYEPNTLRLSTLRTSRSGVSLQDLEYTYDGVGNVTIITDKRDGSNTQTFNYDALNRLTSATGSYGTDTYSYSALGNILTKGPLGAPVTYTYGATLQTCNRLMPHAVTATSDGQRYSYDCNGNLIADGERALTWDADNRPSFITRGEATTTFLYSGDGARVKKTGINATIRYVGGYEDHVTDSSTTKHIRAGGLHVATRVVGGTNPGTYYAHGDHLGSLNVLTSTSGAEVQRLTYLPYGETASDVHTLGFLKLRFTGQEEDPETGLYYYGARYYNPALGRFISADSLVPDPGDPQSLNRYSYVGNNPVTLVDPSGHGSEDDSEGQDDGEGQDDTGYADYSGSAPSTSPPGTPDYDIQGQVVCGPCGTLPDGTPIAGGLRFTAGPPTGPPAGAPIGPPGDPPAGSPFGTLTISPAADPPGFGGSPGGIGPGVGPGTPGAAPGPMGPGLGPGSLGGGLGPTGPMGPGVGPGIGPPSPSAPPGPSSPALAPPSSPPLKAAIDKFYTKVLIGTIAIALGVVAPAVTNVGIQTAIQGFGMIGPTVGVVGSIAGLTVGVVGVGVAITGIGIAVAGIAAMAYSVRYSSSGP